MPDDALCVVQFIHPGGEHRPNSSGIKPWNEGMHQRKFMRSRGRWLEGNETHDGELLFWGEWEPPSVVEELDQPSPDYPRYLHRPYLEQRTHFGTHQNTDPFVFGDRFLYTGCQQWRGKPHGYPVQLRFLRAGSMILFGSHSRGRFVLDTVLVVRDSVDHRRADHVQVLRGRVPDAYWTVTLGPWYSGPDDGRSWRMYRAATSAKPFAGMFSFVPALPADRVATQGFPRPDLSDVAGINPRMKQGWAATKFEGLDDVEAVWRIVAASVSGQGCRLGVRVNMPSVRKGAREESGGGRRRTTAC